MAYQSVEEHFPKLPASNYIREWPGVLIIARPRPFEGHSRRKWCPRLIALRRCSGRLGRASNWTSRELGIWISRSVAPRAIIRPMGEIMSDKDKTNKKKGVKKANWKKREKTLRDSRKGENWEREREERERKKERQKERERATRSRRSVFVAATEEEIKGERTTIGRYSSFEREVFARMPPRASSIPGISPPPFPCLTVSIHGYFAASAAIPPYYYPSVRRSSTCDRPDVVVVAVFISQAIKQYQYFPSAYITKNGIWFSIIFLNHTHPSISPI